MFGSGVRIGMARIIIATLLIIIQKDRRVAGAGCCAAARGSSIRTTAAPPFATGTLPRTGTSSAGFGAPSRGSILEYLNIWTGVQGTKSPVRDIRSRGLRFSGVMTSRLMEKYIAYKRNKR